MVQAAENIPDGTTPNGNGIKVDRRFLHLNPDPCGPQHDAREPGYLWGLIKYPEALRPVNPDGVLHPTVYARFKAAGVSLVQGYLFGRPCPASDLVLDVAATDRVASVA
jgi:hypothetical protein